MEKISKNMDANTQYLKNLFKGDSTFITRPVTCIKNNKLRCTVFFCDGMVSTPVINDSIIKPITLWEGEFDCDNMLSIIKTQMLHSNDIKISSNWKDLLNGLLYGDTLLFCHNSSRALIINTKGFPIRSISEPTNEQVLSGPREGFTEGIMTNISMIRRRLKTPELKFTIRPLGTESNTSCCVCYLENMVDHKVLDQLNDRLDNIKLDGIFSSNYVTELISDNVLSPIRTIGSSERPDIIAAKLLEGRVALIVDGTPVVLTVPYILIEQFQSSEDYYVDFYYATFSRLMRIFGFFLAISILALYIAVITYHPELLPTSLLLSISAARDSVPVPTIFEALVLLITFEILREATTRTPSVVGQTLGIVGALVLGQAAVEARFVSAPMVIVVAFSGITGLMVPRLRGAVTVLRLGLIALSSMLGLFGYMFGMVWFLLHIAGLSSFKIPILSNLTSYKNASHEDSLIRIPWPFMKQKNRFLGGGRRGGEQ